MKKIMLVFGTRPEAIKMCPLVLELRKYPREFECIVCVTGQHRQLLKQVLEIFDISPDYDLNIMRPGQDSLDISARVLSGMKKVLKTCNPDMVLVHGDTTTSMAAALSAFYLKIPVGHVEAGLRTNNLSSPWPEELNRQLTARMSDIHFCPLPDNRDNLLRENVQGKIFVTGNTVIDALHFVLKRLKQSAKERQDCVRMIRGAGYDINRLNEDKKLVLITAHRNENLDDSFVSIAEAISIMREQYPNIDFVYPMHLNPRVRSLIKKTLGKETHRENLFLIEPLDYLSFVYLMWKSSVILTDSGGIQEEAPWIGKPVLVMRNCSERELSINNGASKLVGTETTSILNGMNSLLNGADSNNKPSGSSQFGDGKACKRIVKILRNV